MASPGDVMLPLELKKKKRQRFCIVNENVPGIIGNITGVLGELKVNIEQHVTRSYGKHAFQALEVSYDRETELEDLKRTIEGLNGVINCNIGHFVNIEEINSSCLLRLCIVHQNLPGILGKITSKCGQLQLNINSEINRSKGSVAFTMLDVESNEKKTISFVDLVISAIREINGVMSCDLDNFQQGSTNLETDSQELNSSDSESVVFDSESLRSLASEVAKHADNTHMSLSEAKGSYYDGGGEVSLQLGKVLPMRERKSLTRSDKVVFAMVGLPCRGKSFIGRKLCRFLNWKTRQAKLFNAGKYRRDSADTTVTAKADLFNSTNPLGVHMREQAATRALSDLLSFLENGGRYGIFDATNSVVKRRRQIMNLCQGIANVIFIEVICDDKDILEQNLIAKVRTSPDYAGMTVNEGLKDLKHRIANYEKAYQPIREAEGISYVKLYNLSSKILAHRVYGGITSSILPYLASLHVGARPIYLVRTGLSGNSVLDNTDFSPSAAAPSASLDKDGSRFASQLAKWLETSLWMFSNSEPNITPQKIHRTGSNGNLHGIKEQSKLKVYCSTLKRALETTAMVSDVLETEVETTSLLNPVNQGEFVGLTHSQINKGFPSFYEKWRVNKLHERFPEGESYADVIAKVEHLVISIEQEVQPVLVVSHISCMQILLAYFLNIPVTESMEIEVPLHTVIELQPTSGGAWKEKRHTFS